MDGLFRPYAAAARSRPRRRAWAPSPSRVWATEAALRRVRGPVPDLETGLWVLTDRDLRHTARIRAFLDALSETVKDLRPLLQGDRPGSRPEPESSASDPR